MKPFLPKKLENIAFGLLVAGIMTFVVSLVSTIIAIGFGSPGMFAKWMGAWVTSWAIAFPVILFVAPAVRRFVHSISLQD